MPHIEISAEKIFSIFGMPITNTLLTSWIVVAGLLIFAWLVRRRIAMVPAGTQNVVELGVEKLLGLMEGVFHSREKAEHYFPLIATIFTMILACNWFGVLPGVGSIGFYTVSEGSTAFVPLFRSVASDLNFTLAIALSAVILVNVFGMVAVGLKGHVGKFISFKDPISFFVGILELLGEFAKMISFSFRLFGNIFAGEVLLIITGFLAPFIIPIPFLGLELFVGFIQALVFAMLTMVFVSIAVEHHS